VSVPVHCPPGVGRSERHDWGSDPPFTPHWDRPTISRTMFGIRIDRNEQVALHDQVAAEIRRAIAEGEAAPGERLPLAKDIAAVLGVNKNTVLRAMHILRDEGLLDFQRGRGITVAGSPQQGLVVKRIRELVEFCRVQGYRRDEVVQIIEGLP
jgi:DNA-binding transcriptional regulator YhcF (GntR family)